MSESNVFAQKAGFQVHFKVVVPDESETIHDGKAPNPLATLLKNTEVLIDWMGKNGYEHDTTRDRPRGGGGFKRAETPPPADIPVPECDGEPMEFKEAYTNKDGKAVSARYTCRKGKACTQGSNGYGRTVWEDSWRKEQQLAVGAGYDGDNEDLPFE